MDPFYAVVRVIARFWIWFFFERVEVRHPERHGATSLKEALYHGELERKLWRERRLSGQPSIADKAAAGDDPIERVDPGHSLRYAVEKKIAEASGGDRGDA